MSQLRQRYSQIRHLLVPPELIPIEDDDGQAIFSCGENIEVGLVIETGVEGVRDDARLGRLTGTAEHAVWIGRGHETVHRWEVHGTDETNVQPTRGHELPYLRVARAEEVGPTRQC